MTLDKTLIYLTYKNGGGNQTKKVVVGLPAMTEKNRSATFTHKTSEQVGGCVHTSVSGLCRPTKDKEQISSVASRETARTCSMDGGGLWPFLARAAPAYCPAQGAP